MNTSGQSAWPYLAVGDPSKPNLLLLHGFMGAGIDWEKIAEDLSRDFYCILPDLLGHGANTPSSTAQTLSLSTLAASLDFFLGQLSIRKTHILGYSLGGRIALRYALDYPGKVTSLILESANPGIEDERLREERLELDGQRAAALIASGMDAFIENWYDMPLFSSLHQYPGRLAVLKEQRKKNNATWVNKFLVQLSPGLQTPLWTRLAELHIPVLLLAGKLDKKYVKVTRQMAKSIPNARQVVIPAAGHNVHWEKPQGFSDIVRDFLLPEDV
ncbi:MAG: 2-succinyl-6-hydroxy-2,4-cyclohexadiene-1-carboxylate synthase [Chloroflexi bacterium]|nr:MAG: 2-succinyl-6-hydroxy-2,4-cyclohexadiene-1-carboxylate synthase [Chloroflexota bacterium]MBL1193449.1 2-succinyl-6-hydroxy-2,4-cyclohexadiene-1-carboxylate synthase [Chloroflexota bacterium]NOH10740.1 2-succinyl-6-hydroxy-2,4-cyclohexadiene-1-carboxylate synthase [Chloroflexota bacterium]